MGRGRRQNRGNLRCARNPLRLACAPSTSVHAFRQKDARGHGSEGRAPACVFGVVDSHRPVAPGAGRSLARQAVDGRAEARGPQWRRRGGARGLCRRADAGESDGRLAVGDGCGVRRRALVKHRGLRLFGDLRRHAVPPARRSGAGRRDHDDLQRHGPGADGVVAAPRHRLARSPTLRGRRCGRSAGRRLLPAAQPAPSSMSTSSAHCWCSTPLS